MKRRLGPTVRRVRSRRRATASEEAGEPARAVRQDERGPGRPQGRYAQAGCRSGRIVVHEARACRHCGAGLRPIDGAGHGDAASLDLPAKLIEVTEHRRFIYACAGCGGRTGAAFPAGVEAPAQYGERLRAAAVYLHLQPLIPEERTAETLADLFGVPSICSASVMDWVRRKANALAPAAARIGALVAAARGRCLDETGSGSPAKRNGCTRSQPKASRSTASRTGGATCRTRLPAAWPSMTASNLWRLERASHALCNAHHLRELKALIEFDQSRGGLMRDCLLDANRAVGDAKARGESTLDAAVPSASTPLLGHPARRVASTASCPASSGRHGQDPSEGGREPVAPAASVQGRRPALPRRLRGSLHNNLAEQALRMMKVKMKISGAFRTFDAAQDFAALRSIVATARKQGCNILQTLTRDAPPSSTHSQSDPHFLGVIFLFKSAASH